MLFKKSSGENITLVYVLRDKEKCLHLEKRRNSSSKNKITTKKRFFYM